MNKKFLSHLTFVLSLLILISPSLFYYITEKKVTGYLPLFLALQILALLIIPVFSKLTLRIVLLIYLPFFIFTLFQWANFNLFQFEMSEGAILAVMGTNSSEAYEFVQIFNIKNGIIPEIAHKAISILYSNMFEY